MTADRQDNLTQQGALAQDFLTQIGQRIRGRRRDRALTVQELADRSQISRRLLTQIEHGQANPSLVAISRISAQLGTDLTTLIAEPPKDSPIEVYDAGAQVLVWSSPLGSTAHLLSATADTRLADLWLWRLVPGDAYGGNADPARSQELFYVISGSLTLAADGRSHAVRAGESARLRSDREYSYANDDDQDAVFIRTVSLISDAKGTIR